LLMYHGFKINDQCTAPNWGVVARSQSF
jgi:hypothetical protein